MDLTVNQLMRVAHLRRWHMVRTARDQTLAEHITLVQIIGLDVVARLGHDQFLQEQVRRWAYWHDMPEVVTGDVSPPFKTMADTRVRGIIDDIECDIDRRYESVMSATSETALTIVKFADMLEAALFLRDEGIGPRAAEIAAEIESAVDRVVDEIRDETLRIALIETRRQLVRGKP